MLVEPTGKRAVATLADVLGPELLSRTASTVEPSEIAVLAGADVPVAHCPRSNALLGCGTAPLAAMREAGIRVGLGTDSPASTPSFDPWEEMRAAVAAARARERRPDALDAASALHLATLGGQPRSASKARSAASPPANAPTSPSSQLQEARTIPLKIQPSPPSSPGRQAASWRRSSTERPATAKE